MRRRTFKEKNVVLVSSSDRYGGVGLYLRFCCGGDDAQPLDGRPQDQQLGNRPQLYIGRCSRSACSTIPPVYLVRSMKLLNTTKIPPSYYRVFGPWPLQRRVFGVFSHARRTRNKRIYTARPRHERRMHLQLFSSSGASYLDLPDRDAQPSHRSLPPIRAPQKVPSPDGWCRLNGTLRLCTSVVSIRRSRGRGSSENNFSSTIASQKDETLAADRGGGGTPAAAGPCSHDTWSLDPQRLVIERKPASEFCMMRAFYNALPVT